MAYDLGVVVVAAAAAEAVCFSSLFLSLATVPRSCGIGLGSDYGIIHRKNVEYSLGELRSSKEEKPQSTREIKIGVSFS